MAEAICDELYGNDFEFASAGLSAYDGLPMCIDAKNALIRAGYDEKGLNFYHSRRLTKEMIENADRIVCVTKDHESYLKSSYPSYSEKISSFMHDVDAPGSGDDAGYDRCFESLCAETENILYPGGNDRWKSKSEK